MAVKWSLPVWVVTVSAIGASMLLTNFVEEIGTPEALNASVSSSFSVFHS